MQARGPLSAFRSREILSRDHRHRALQSNRRHIPNQAFLKWLSGLSGGGKASPTPRYPKERDDLLQLLLQGVDGPGERRRASELVDSLAASPQPPFDERQLGGGAWVVRYTKGAPLLWRATYGAGKLVNGRNTASQAFDPSARAAVNRAEYAGGDVFVTATGEYQPVDADTALPKRISVTIARGALHLWGREVPLPIRGTGEFEVVYLDSGLRIFKSKGAVAVQVRQDLLPAPAAA